MNELVFHADNRLLLSPTARGQLDLQNSGPTLSKKKTNVIILCRGNKQQFTGSTDHITSHHPDSGSSSGYLLDLEFTDHFRANVLEL